MQRSTFLPLHHAATLIPSVDWGLEIRDILLLRRTVSRGEYWVSLAVTWVIVMVLMFIVVEVAASSGWVAFFIGLLGSPFAFYFLFAVMAGRCRDAGHSSWAAFRALLLLPLGPAIMVMIGFAPSKEHYRWIPGTGWDIFD